MSRVWSVLDIQTGKSKKIKFPVSRFKKEKFTLAKAANLSGNSYKGIAYVGNPYKGIAFVNEAGRRAKWLQILDSKLQAPSFKFHVPSFKFHVPSFKFHVPSFKFRVPSFKFHVSNSEFHVSRFRPAAAALISIFMVFSIVKAGSLTPSSAPGASGYTMNDIYTRLSTNATSTEANHSFSPGGAPAGTLRTLTEIYNAIPTIDPTKLLASATYLGITGAIAELGSFALTASSADQAVSAGYYSGGVLSGDEDLVAANIRNGTNIFGVIGSLVVGYVYGDDDASKVLTTASSAGTYNAANLSTATVKKGTAFGVSSTGAYSGYPGTGWTGGAAITQAACDAQNPTWYWFEDANGDGDTTDPEDGVCVRATGVTSSSWNGATQVTVNNLGPLTATGGTGDSIYLSSANWTADAYKYHFAKITTNTGAGCWGIVKTNTATSITVYGSWLDTSYVSDCVAAPDDTSIFQVYDDNYYDNSWIGDWTCDGAAFPNGAPVFGSYPTTAQVGAGFVALATTDCYDGVRDLLPTVDESSSDSRIVVSGTAESGSDTVLIDNDISLDTNAWIGQKVKIFSGTSAGSSGIIESNTATSVTVSAWSAGNPGSDSQYGIIYIIPRSSYTVHALVNGTASDLKQNNGPLKAEDLNNWKGTRLPTSSDFFGFCGYKDGGLNYENSIGSNTANKNYGNYGGQNGRTDEFLDLANSGSWEWLSEQTTYYNARIAGYYACSTFTVNNVPTSTRFRSVFRP